MASVTTPNGFELDDSGQRVVVDPICRIEGHLRIEVNLDENNVIRNAVSTGNMWRGLEVILKGRDPRDAWAFTERICGVCTGVHALQSVRAVEDALSIEIPTNANHIRNLMMLAQYCHDHIVHFYHLHALDWVDVVSALSADPKATSELQQAISPWPKSSPAYFRDVQNLGRGVQPSSTDKSNTEIAEENRSAESAACNSGPVKRHHSRHQLFQLRCSAKALSVRIREALQT